MTIFPSLSPATRTFTPGEYPTALYQSMNGKQVAVRSNTVMVASRLSLSFVAISEANMLSILSHYQGRSGSWLSFAIPSDLLDGFTATDFTLSGYAWRYIDPPDVEDVGCGLHNVAVVLESVPGEGATAPGLNASVRLTLAPGAATAAASVAGFSLTVTAAFSGGAATSP